MHGHTAGWEAQGSGKWSGKWGWGCLGKRMVPRPQFSGQLTQTRETDLSGRPEGWKEQEGCTGKGSVKGEI